MTPDEMHAQATKRLSDGADDMLLTVIRSKEPRGETIRLLGSSGPVGRIVGTFDHHGRVRVAAFFQCRDVLAMIATGRGEGGE